MTALPSDWKSLRLDEICGFHRGLTYKKTDEVDFSTNAVLRANNVSLESGELDLTEIRYIDDQIKIPAAKMVRKGSLLVCMASGSKKHLGKAALIDEDYGYAFGGFMGLLLPNAIVYPKYLYWITQSKDYSDYIMGLSDGANINNLKFSQLGQYQVSLPPIAEQQRIVAILDEAFAGIATAVANTEKNLANARELFESSLASLIPQTSGGATPGQDWQSFKLGDICVVDWGNTSLTKKAYVDGGDFLAVSAAGPDGRIGHAEHKRFTPVLSAIGAKCGRMFFPEEDFTAIKNTITLTPVERLVTNRFLFFLLSVVTLPQRGAGQPFISKGDIQRFPAEIPRLPDQERIVTMLDELGAETRQLQFVYEQKLDALGELKSSLLQKAFSGELTAAPRGEIETALA